MDVCERVCVCECTRMRLAIWMHIERNPGKVQHLNGGKPSNACEY